MQKPGDAVSPLTQRAAAETRLRIAHDLVVDLATGQSFHFMKWFFIWLDDKVCIHTIAPDPNVKALITQENMQSKLSGCDLYNRFVDA